MHGKRFRARDPDGIGGNGNPVRGLAENERPEPADGKIAALALRQVEEPSDVCAAWRKW